MSEGHSPLAVLGTVIFYMIVAISMTLLNKSVLSTTPLPVFLLFCQSAVGFLLLMVESKIGPYKLPKLDTHTARNLVPLCIVNVLGLTFNNACLQYVDASFHQVARGLVLPCTILTSIFLLRERQSNLSLIAAFIVTSGFFSGVIFDPNHSSSQSRSVLESAKGQSLGVIFGVLSSFLSAGHAVLIKRGLSAVSGSPIALAHYNNILSTIFLIPIVLLAGEAPGALALIGGNGASRFLWGAFITGLFGFLISLAAVLSIKVTSPVTHMISSAARGVLQTLLAIEIFGDVMSGARIISIILIIGGSILYVYSKADSPPPPPPPTIPHEEAGKSLHVYTPNPLNEKELRHVIHGQPNTP